MPAEGGELTPSFQLIGSFADFDLDRLLTHAYARPALRALVSEILLSGAGTSTRNIFASLSGRHRSRSSQALSMRSMSPSYETVWAFSRTEPKANWRGIFWKGRENFSRGLGLLTLREGRLETNALEILRQDERLLAKRAAMWISLSNA